MYKIVSKRQLNPSVTMMEIEAPFIARKVKAGQFIIFRIDEKGERVPLTVADKNPETGTVTIIFQAAGASTMRLAEMEAGDEILDFVGPLGEPTHLEGYKRACVIGGGVGCAIAYPSAKALHEMGCKVDVIAGFRNKDIVILEDEFKAVSDNLYITTDDGTYARHGFVTDVLKEQVAGATGVAACGPKPMLKAIAAIAKEAGVPCQVSMEERMGCGIGACLVCACALKSENGETRYGHVCKDGPVFNAEEVEW